MQSNNDNFNTFGPNHNPNNFIGNNIGLSSVTGGSPAGVPPPLPPRPNGVANGSNIYRYGNNYGSGFGQPMSAGYSPYSSMHSCGPFNTMSPFGSYGFNNMNRFNASYGNENDFVRIAEESSRQAFQSIESIVQAFGSVSMMLESTYYAVHSSFRAVIGVADHFSRLRQHLTQILSTLAIIRTLKWIIRRLLHLLGVRRLPNDPEERAWNQASRPDTAGSSINPLDTESSELVSRSRSSWPIIIFFGVVFGTPWLIWRLLSTITGSDKTASDKWMTGEDDHYVATALYDFRTDIPRELAFTVGQNLIIAPKELQPRVRGWLLATIDGKKVGLIPANYVRVVSRNPKRDDSKRE